MDKVVQEGALCVRLIIHSSFIHSSRNDLWTAPTVYGSCVAPTPLCDLARCCWTCQCRFIRPVMRLIISRSCQWIPRETAATWQLPSRPVGFRAQRPTWLGWAHQQLHDSVLRCNSRERIPFHDRTWAPWPTSSSSSTSISQPCLSLFIATTTSINSTNTHWENITISLLACSCIIFSLLLMSDSLSQEQCDDAHQYLYSSESRWYPHPIGRIRVVYGGSKVPKYSITVISSSNHQQGEFWVVWRASELIWWMMVLMVLVAAMWSSSEAASYRTP